MKPAKGKTCSKRARDLAMVNDLIHTLMVPLMSTHKADDHIYIEALRERRHIGALVEQIRDPRLR